MLETKQKTYTFWQLIQQYKIEIPMIQRDYAQGREDMSIQQIREALLQNIYDALENHQPLDFDFIYGSLKNDTLIPLDGQQRLTTLFLLHWYFAMRENIDLTEELCKFTYATRISSRDFCIRLVRESVKFEELDDKILSQVICDKTWFFHNWKDDATVRSMLVMLDSIHEKFKSTSNVYLSLLQSKDSPITFSFLELENYGLSDSLYIKMNSRGKPLSDFENFKAQFEQFLEEQGMQEELEVFSQKIDNKWTDFLWDYRTANGTIDQPFMNLFRYISEMLLVRDTQSNSDYQLSKLLKNISNDVKNFSQIKKIYKDRKNVQFLFSVLDLWGNKDDAESDMLNIFHEKVPLFGGNIQLVNGCIEGKLQLFEQALFFAILLKKVHGYTDDISEFVRVIRNFLLRIKQLTNARYNSNLRIENLQKIFISIESILYNQGSIYDVLVNLEGFQGVTKESFNQEKEKANLIVSDKINKTEIHSLEDLKWLKGAIHHFIPALSIYPTGLSRKIEMIYSENSSLVARAMLTVGDYAPEIGWSYLGVRYLFGGKDSYWEVILTYHNHKDLLNGKYFIEFFKKIDATKGSCVKERLQEMCSQFIKKTTDTNWLYYFVKYPTMLKTDNMIFTYWDEEHFPYRIERLSGVNLLSTHINPFYEAVILELNNLSYCSLGDSTVRNSEESILICKNGFQFSLNGKGWKWVVDDTIDQQLRGFYKQINKEDIVQQGVKLIQRAFEIVEK